MKTKRIKDKKDNTFKIVGLLFMITIPAVAVLAALGEGGLALSDALLAAFCLLILEFLCCLGHKMVNTKIR